MSINFRMELYIKDSGGDLAEKDTEFKYGQMVPNISDYGKKIKLMVKVSLFTPTGTSTKVNGSRIKPMVTGDISTQTELCMKVNGSTIFKMD